MVEQRYSNRYRTIHSQSTAGTADQLFDPLVNKPLIVDLIKLLEYIAYFDI